MDAVAGGFEQEVRASVRIGHNLAHLRVTGRACLPFGPGEQCGADASPPPRGMDIGLGAAVLHGRPPDKLIRRLDDDHAALVIGQVERLLDVGRMDFGHAVIGELARSDESRDRCDVYASRGASCEARDSRQYHAAGFVIFVTKASAASPEVTVIS
jgi:hypothetical protein